MEQIAMFSDVVGKPFFAKFSVMELIFDMPKTMIRILPTLIGAASNVRDGAREYCIDVPVQIN